MEGIASFKDNPKSHMKHSHNHTQFHLETVHYRNFVAPLKGYGVEAEHIGATLIFLYEFIFRGPDVTTAKEIERLTHEVVVNQSTVKGEETH